MKTQIFTHLWHFVSPQVHSNLYDWQDNYVVSENAWLHPTVLRALVPDLLFTPWWRKYESPTFLKPMFNQISWRCRRSRIVNWQSRTRSPEVSRVAVISWHLCVDFSEAMGGGIAGEHPFEFVSVVLTIYLCTYRRCLGTNIFCWEQ